MKKEFKDIIYNDDRMFVLYLCKCTIKDKEGERFITTTIHHDEIPDDFIWSVITFRNNERYTAVKGNHFKTKEEAKAFIRETYPTVPLISLNGEAPQKPLQYDEFVNWCRNNDFKEYDYKKMFSSDVPSDVSSDAKEARFETMLTEKTPNK